MAHKIKGHVVLQKKNFLDFKDFAASVADNLHELVRKGVSIQLVGANIDPHTGTGNLGEPAVLEKWLSTHEGLLAGENAYQVECKWDSRYGTPVAFFIRNSHHSEFYLKSLTLHHEGTTVHFDCNSWVYPVNKYKADRVFFSNQSYLPGDTPPALVNLRSRELEILRGNGHGTREEWDRVYDYDVYNDLGDPDKDNELKRPVLGGSEEYPYPRRCRTGRPPTETDPASESRLPLVSLNIYVPRDERFGRVKFSDFLAYSLKSILQFVVPQVTSVFDSTPKEFDSFEDIMKLYTDGIRLPENHVIEAAKDFIPLELIKQFLKTEGEPLHKYPYPQVIEADQHAWRKDEEFAREMLSGVNPVRIERLHSFPPKSKLDPNVYGPQSSSITAAHIEKNLAGLTANEALEKNKLFILDHYESLIPYINQINALASSKTYATRTILFLKEDGTLKPVAIELSLPPSEGRPSVRKVLTPSEEGPQGALWQLAKAYVAVNDSGIHELISHWLKTHASTEPYIIAANRQLSVMHPVYKLLSPHFVDTLNINALSRQILINAGGILENSVFSGKYSMEMSAVVYKDWRFDQEGIPADLLKRGMATVDESMPHGLKLIIEDYPYAVDGLEIWSAIESWVREYLSIYYNNDELVRADTELQAWWHEVRYVGHADKKDETWWYKMDSVAELEKTITTIIWVASALHAATNFGQFAYSGYMPNRPAVSRKLLPEEGSEEFSELATNPDLVFLKTVANRFQATLGMSIIEILSRHSTAEVYLGQRDTSGWTENNRILEAFERFGCRLKEIEKIISERNEDAKLKNRSGPAQVPYTLLYPSTSDVSHKGGMTGRGIPNSVSI
uniref:Lipoxygenase n=1 Tax=Araucaria cunninghamii TaxID=56994 RepID=A0A0D6QVF8_ARACU